MLFELWDVETGNVIGTFASEDDALGVVRELIELNGVSYADALDLGRIDGDGHSTPIATGQALANRVGIGSLDDRPTRRLNRQQPIREPCTSINVVADPIHGSRVTEMHRYSIQIAWSDQNQLYVVSLPEWGDVVHTHGHTYHEALERGQELIEALIAARQQRGEALPEPRAFVSV